MVLPDPNELSEIHQTLGTSLDYSIRNSLLNIAIRGRTCLDNVDSLDSCEETYKNYKTHVTDHLKDTWEYKSFSEVLIPGTLLLSIREVFNKIIHASEFSYDRCQTIDMKKYHYTYREISNRVILSGSKKKEDWVIIINLLNFCETMFYFEGNFPYSKHV